MVKTATAAGDAASSVLRFWRDTEIFNIPQAPKVKDGNERICIRHLVAGEALPWVRGHRGTLLPPSADEDWVHAVYVGVAKAREWAEVVLCVVSPQERLQEDDLQRIGGHGWLGAFVVTSEGFAATDSFVPAGFSVGVERLREGKTLDGLSASIEAVTEAFKSRRKTVNADGESGSPAGGQGRQLVATAESGTQEPVAPTPSAGTPITRQDLDDELSEALRPFGDLVKGMKFGVVVKSSLRKRRRTDDDDDAKVELDIEFLNSFYLDDLDRLIAQADEGREFGAGLNRYLGPDSTPAERRDTLKQHDAMAACLSPSQMPHGRWPSPKSHHLMLAQQAAVGEICGQMHDAAGLVSVNGPPGTGKTTLLCDVIAEVVVDRATKLAALSQPWDAFAEKTTVGGMSVFALKSEIVGGTGIVVASNNDAAVKNITQELPAFDKIAAAEHPDAAYFQQVAQRVFDSAKIKKPAWGLIAGALGSLGNRRTFANALFNPFGSDKAFEPSQPCDIKTVLRAQNGAITVNDWRQAKREFLLLMDDVERYQAQCAACHRALLDVRPAETDLVSRRAVLGKLREGVVAALATCDAEIDEASAGVEAAEGATADAQTREQDPRASSSAGGADRLRPSGRGRGGSSASHLGSVAPCGGVFDSAHGSLAGFHTSGADEADSVRRSMA